MQGLVAKHGDEKVDTAEKELLEELAQALKFPEDQVAKTLEIVESADGDLMDALADQLTDPTVKLYMMIDLWRMAWRDGNLHENEAEMISAFAPIFKMDEEDMAFVTEFGKAFAPEGNPEAIPEIENPPEAYSKKCSIISSPNSVLSVWMVAH